MLSIDLQKRIIHLNDNNKVNFEVEDFLIDRIIYGLDDIDITLNEKDSITNFESKRRETKPWIYINE